MAAHQAFRQAQFPAQFPNLVLEQLAKGLDHLHLHALRQAADVVVRLDGDARPARGGDRLDDVRIQGALRQEIRSDVARDLLELLHEHAANGLPLRFRFRDAVERRQERIARIHGAKLDVEASPEGRLDLVCLARAQEAVVDEHAGQAVTDRLVDQACRHGTVDTAGQAADDPSVAHLVANACYRLRTNSPDRPRAAQPGDVPHETAQER